MKVGRESVRKPGQPLRVAVFGAGISGRAVSRWLNAIGGAVTLFDDKAADVERDFKFDSLADFDVFVFSPGIPPQHPWRQLVSDEVAPECIFGEVGFALKDWPGRILGVTGTNGKTTVTMLLADLLQAHVKGRVVSCGNIGKTCVEAMLETVNAGADDWLVVELSSFQAMNCNGIRLDGLIWTNFAPDHLDYHGSETAYFTAKAALAGTLKDGAPLVTDAAFAGRLAKILPSQQQRIALGTPCESDYALVDLPLLPESFQRMPQRMNLVQATMLLRALGFAPDPAVHTAVLASFEMPSHRLHPVATIQGIRYWNDSKATNPHAALSAIGGFGEPICWLAGGRNKGMDLRVFAHDAAKRMPGGSLVITTGEAGPAFAEALSEHSVEVIHHADPFTLVGCAHMRAKAKGLQTVVFSPGFASFDSFRGYAERGKNFISQVLCLKEST
jgi:UDP-N-acetylmuramoylalanine--D-glutamate ligase